MTVERDTEALEEGVAVGLAESDPGVSVSNSPTQEDWYWGRNTAGAEEDYFWRRLSDNWYQKDVIPSTYLELHNQCYEQYNANPLAMYVIELTTNFVLGEGVMVEAKSKKVQKVIDAFWNDRHNQMSRRVYWLCSELSLYGELFVRFFVNPYTGDVQIGQVDPSLVDQIETDTDNIEHPIRFHKRPVGPGNNVWSTTVATTSGQQITHPAGTSYDVQPGGIADPAPQETMGTVPPTDVLQGEWLSAWPHFEDGQVFQYAINKVSNAKRGKSDLATLLPWLRRYRDWLIDRVRINKYKGAFLWDVTLTGADRKTIQNKRMEYSYPPEPGSMVIHNESEVWAAVQPQINADDVAADGKAIKMMVAMGAGLPEHYLAEGGAVNYATSIEMGLPTFRKFKRRQDEFRILLSIIIDRVLDEAVRAGKLGASTDRTYKVVLPELAPDDNGKTAAAGSTMVAALFQAAQAGWVSDETAMRMFFESAGGEINLEEELARVAKQREERAAAAAAAGMVPSGMPGHAGMPFTPPDPVTPETQPAKGAPSESAAPGGTAPNAVPGPAPREGAGAVVKEPGETKQNIRRRSDPTRTAPRVARADEVGR